MNKIEASAVIEQHRNHTLSQETEDILASQAERVFFILALIHAGVAVTLWFVLPSFVTRAMGSAGFVIATAILYWQFRRYKKIRAVLSASNVKADTDFI